MKDFLKRAVISLNTLSDLKKSGMLNQKTAEILISAHIKSDPSQEFELLNNVIQLSKLFGSPFNKPDESVDGQIRFALTEKNIPIGINPEEPHCLISGQSGSGKSVLLKIIFAQALIFNKDNKENKDVQR